MRLTLKCDCCSGGHKEGMAYLEQDRLVIVRRQHGREHTLVITLDKLRDMSALFSQQAVPS